MWFAIRAQLFAQPGEGACLLQVVEILALDVLRQLLDQRARVVGVEQHTRHALQAELQRGRAAPVAIDYAVAPMPGRNDAERLEQSVFGDRHRETVHVAGILAHALRIGIQRARVEI